MINPAFLRYPEEARLLGELLLGYSELDITFAMLTGNAISQKFALLHAVNKVRSETQRLDIAHAMSVNQFAELGLAKEYDRVHRAMRFCLKVRNQWAHSQWGDMHPHGLAFTRSDGDVYAHPIKPTVWTSITATLLRRQEEFFENTRQCLLVVDSNLIPILAGRKPARPMPAELHAPSMHDHWSKAAREFIKRTMPNQG